MTLPVAHFDPFAGAPRLHGAARVGIRPGTELIHPLAATGERPLRFAVGGLPSGLTVDDEGIVRGLAPAEPGTHELDVRVENALGAATQRVELVVGDILCLTPPLGWNSWNVYAHEISADIVVRTAEAMVATGMRDLGYQYVNIDDHWHAPERLAGGRPAADPVRFPEGIAAVAERVHALGLKLGVYSDAAHLTCGNCFGGHGYERIDAEAYAEWGVDLLKYDWCYAPKDRASAVERYGTMRRALDATDRSIVLSVCEWGIRKPWRWAGDLGASYWRTTNDIFDTFGWSPLGVLGIARRNLRLASYAGPGRWNDPDMLLVGNRGRGLSTSVLRTPNSWPKPVRGRAFWRFGGLDDTQAQTHLSLWVMMAAPLLASHDLTDDDPASSRDVDRALLTNPDVLAIDQDALGRQGRLAASPRGTWTVVKPLTEGRVAVSVTNLRKRPRTVQVRVADVAGSASAHVRDAWAMADLGVQTELVADLPGHGTAMFVCTPTPQQH